MAQETVAALEGAIALFGQYGKSRRECFYSSGTASAFFKPIHVGNWDVNGFLQGDQRELRNFLPPKWTGRYILPLHKVTGEKYTGAFPSAGTEPDFCGKKGRGGNKLSCPGHSLTAAPAARCVAKRGYNNRYQPPSDLPCRWRVSSREYSGILWKNEKQRRKTHAQEYQKIRNFVSER